MKKLYASSCNFNKDFQEPEDQGLRLQGKGLENRPRPRTSITV